MTHESLTVVDYSPHGRMFALQMRPFFGAQRVLLGQIQEPSHLCQSAIANTRS